MTKQEIALQLTLKVIDSIDLASLRSSLLETPYKTKADYAIAISKANISVAENVIEVFNSIFDGIHCE